MDDLVSKNGQTNSNGNEIKSKLMANWNRVADKVYQIYKLNINNNINLINDIPNSKCKESIMDMSLIIFDISLGQNHNSDHNNNNSKSNKYDYKSTKNNTYNDFKDADLVIKTSRYVNNNSVAPTLASKSRISFNTATINTTANDRDSVSDSESESVIVTRTSNGNISNKSQRKWNPATKFNKKPRQPTPAPPRRRIFRNQSNDTDWKSESDQSFDDSSYSSGRSSVRSNSGDSASRHRQGYTSSHRNINRPVIQRRERLRRARRHQTGIYSTYKFLKEIGSGAQGSIELVANKNNGKKYVLKRMVKTKTESKEEDSTRHESEFETERKHLRILTNNKSKFCINIVEYYTQDQDFDYLVLPYFPNGDLFALMTNRKYIFDENTIKFYAACIVIAFEEMEESGIIHRDFKPENVLIDKNYYATLADFGLSTTENDSENAVGTTMYLDPNVVNGAIHTHCMDLWSFGVWLYEMVTGGKCPFKAMTDDLVDNASYTNKRKCKKDVYDDGLFEYCKEKDFVLKFPSKRKHKYGIMDCISNDCIDLIRQLLVFDETKRLGYHFGVAELKQHSWFKHFDWDSLTSKKMIAPLILAQRKSHRVGN